MHLDACPKRFDSVQKSQTHSNHFRPREGPGVSKIVQQYLDLVTLEQCNI